ncbi:hypothetical protein PoB_007316300 [Plakobranchus ocellatus]|uniref:Uncharacterized protein n=1 Tax=Plakobranchus ocellatus TaxID=259542 RepID=A0AAV4DRH6_9GAST|nr:hypothetical protein PoB_007316300 [Plakobranchus ocellatus]
MVNLNGLDPLCQLRKVVNPNGLDPPGKPSLKKLDLVVSEGITGMQNQEIASGDEQSIICTGERNEIGVSDASVARWDDRCYPDGYLKYGQPRNRLDPLHQSQEVIDSNRLDPPYKPQKLVNHNSLDTPYQPQGMINPNALDPPYPLRRSKDHSACHTPDRFSKREVEQIQRHQIMVIPAIDPVEQLGLAVADYRRRVYENIQNNTEEDIQRYLCREKLQRDLDTYSNQLMVDGEGLLSDARDRQEGRKCVVFDRCNLCRMLRYPEQTELLPHRWSISCHR